MAIPDPRAKLAGIIRRAPQIDLGSLSETELEASYGRRLGTIIDSSGFGPIDHIADWTPDQPFEDVDWDLTVQTSPRRLQVINRLQKMNKTWIIAVDASATMHFGTEGDIKLVTGATLAATFDQAAAMHNDDRIHAVFDERILGKVLEFASTEDMVLSILSHNPGRVPRKVIGEAKGPTSGLSSLFTQLPDDPAIIVLISDFISIGKSDPSLLVQASHHHKLICCVVEDAREIRFPSASGQIELSDMTTGRRETMTFAQAHKLVSADHKRRVAALTDLFRRARAQYGFFEGGDSPTTIRNKIMRMLHNGV